MDAADPHPWRVAVWLGLFAVAATVVGAMAVGPHFTPGGKFWWIPGDAWTSLHAAHYVADGAYPLIYETGTTRAVYDGGPLLPLFLAPIALLSNLFHLGESFPMARRHPSAWLLLGPYTSSTAIPLLYATRRLATQLGLRRNRVQLQCAVLLLAFVPMAVVYGHYEDVLALAFVMLALRDVLADGPVRGALMLAIAIAFKQWALLVVPMYAVMTPTATRVRAVLLSMAPPGLLMLLFIALDFKYASRALLHPPAFTDLGHSALWIAPATTSVSSAPTRLIVVALAIGAAWLVRNQREPALVVGALGAVLLVRFLFEPAAHAYYLAPGIALLVVAEYARRGRAPLAIALGAALLLAFPFHPNRVLWWTAMAVCTCVLVGRLIRVTVVHSQCSRFGDSQSINSLRRIRGAAETQLSQEKGYM